MYRFPSYKLLLLAKGVLHTSPLPSIAIFWSGLRELLERHHVDDIFEPPPTFRAGLHHHHGLLGGEVLVLEPGQDLRKQGERVSVARIPLNRLNKFFARD